MNCPKNQPLDTKAIKDHQESIELKAIFASCDVKNVDWYGRCLVVQREIVLNAIIHRDYTSPSDSVVKIFDDRIEFFNPGGLPDGLTVETLLKGQLPLHHSQPQDRGYF